MPRNKHSPYKFLDSTKIWSRRLLENYCLRVAGVQPEIYGVRFVSSGVPEEGVSCILTGKFDNRQCESYLLSSLSLSLAPPLYVLCVKRFRCVCEIQESSASIFSRKTTIAIILYLVFLFYDRCTRATINYHLCKVPDHHIPYSNRMR